MPDCQVQTILASMRHEAHIPFYYENPLHNMHWQNMRWLFNRLVGGCVRLANDLCGPTTNQLSTDEQ